MGRMSPPQPSPLPPPRTGRSEGQACGPCNACNAVTPPTDGSIPPPINLFCFRVLMITSWVQLYSSHCSTRTALSISIDRVYVTSYGIGRYSVTRVTPCGDSGRAANNSSMRNHGTAQGACQQVWGRIMRETAKSTLYTLEVCTIGGARRIAGPRAGLRRAAGQAASVVSAATWPEHRAGRRLRSAGDSGAGASSNVKQKGARQNRCLAPLAARFEPQIVAGLTLGSLSGSSWR